MATTSTELQGRLDDARDDLARYRRLITWTGTGFIVGLLGFLSAVPMILARLNGGAVASVMVPFGALAFARAVWFISTVAAATDTNDDGDSTHPAARVRRLERARDRAIIAENLDR